jgi:hypothetical protein
VFQILGGKMKNVRYSLLCLLLFSAALLASCNQPAFLAPFNIATATSTPNAIPIVLSAEIINKECVHPQAATPMKFIFRNITNQSIRIRNSFSVLPKMYNLTPTITDGNGAELIDSIFWIRLDQFPTPPSPAYQEIAPNDRFELVTNYFFPDSVSPAGEFDRVFPVGSKPTVFSPEPGKYFIKFEYRSFALSVDDHIWEGAVESNQVEICIK